MILDHPLLRSNHLFTPTVVGKLWRRALDETSYFDFAVISDSIARAGVYEVPLSHSSPDPKFGRTWLGKFRANHAIYTSLA